MAEAWARKFLEDRFVAADVRSAGTHAWDAAEAGAYTTDAMREIGFDLRAHRTTRVTAELLEWADVVAVMEPMHAEVVLELLPEVEAKLHRVWTFLPGNPDHVTDPHGHQLDAHRTAAQAVGGAVKALIDQWFAERRAARS
jgi:protein-tyrosine-phosphatase